MLPLNCDVTVRWVITIWPRITKNKKKCCFYKLLKLIFLPIWAILWPVWASLKPFNLRNVYLIAVETTAKYFLWVEKSILAGIYWILRSLAFKHNFSFCKSTLNKMNAKWSFFQNKKRWRKSFYANYLMLQRYALQYFTCKERVLAYSCHELPWIALPWREEMRNTGVNYDHFTSWQVTPTHLSRTISLTSK